MKKSMRLLILVGCLVAWVLTGVYQTRMEAQSVADLVAATNAFLVSLTPEQAAKVRYPFADAERQNWYFVPMERNGLTFKDMQPFQERLAFAMVNAALSSKGFIKATTIMSLEDVLRIQESGGGRGAASPAAAAPAGAAPPAGAPAAGAPARGGGQARGGRGGFVRDPQLHYITIFGDPSNTGKWGWRLEGHHMSVNVTLDKGKFVGSSPTFFGSNPAEVREGPRTGLRALAAEEDLARELLASLDANQKKTAILPAAAPNDIITGNQRQIQVAMGQVGAAAGINAAALNTAQKAMLTRLIEEYVHRNNAEAAAAKMTEIRAGLNNVYFAWMGTEARNAAHYYRIQSPTFLIEYDNTQNNANHIHSVFRDLNADWGGKDYLALHYLESHQKTAE